MNCIICMNQSNDCVKHFHHHETLFSISWMVPLQLHRIPLTPDAEITILNIGFCVWLFLSFCFKVTLESDDSNCGKQYSIYFIFILLLITFVLLQFQPRTQCIRLTSLQPPLVSSQPCILFLHSCLLFCFVTTQFTKMVGYWLGAIHWRFVGSSFWNITQGYTAPPPKSSISNSTTRKGRTSLMPPWSMLTLTGPVCVGLVQAIIATVWFWLQ